MADEAFALSPMSARAAQPSEADYEAIRDAFMETSRGRWFLGEYARRNRNADTAMVLEAVARIEQSLAAQKMPARDPALHEALGAIRAALEAARIAASAALGDLALAENLAPLRKGARVIREISWRLREIGADGRICDLIDSQVGAIEEASGKLAAIDPAVALSAAFELIEGRIGAFDAGQTATAAAEPVEEAPEPSPQAADEAYPPPMPLEENAAAEAAAWPAPAAGGQDAAEAITGTVQAEADGDAIAANTKATNAEAADAEAAKAEAAKAEAADAYDAQDETMLDMIAAEMAAPDTDEAYVPPGMALEDSEAADPSEAESAVAAEPAAPAAAPLLQAAPPLPEAAEGESRSVSRFESDPETRLEARAAPSSRSSLQPSSQPSLQPSPQPAPKSSPQPPPESSARPSLGSSLIANGIVQRPRVVRADPLAPIRRMSHSERIAFFS